MVPQGQQAQQPPPTSGLAIAALIVSFIPCMCIWVAGVIMGVVALNQIKARPHELGGRGLAIAAIIIGCTWGLLGTVGTMAAIAIPNFLKFQARSKQSECKTNLKSAYLAEKAYFGEHEAFTTDPEAAGFAPMKGRYQYIFTDGAEAAELPTSVRDEVGLMGKCPDCSITIACAGNVDNDETLDIWTISTADRPGAPAGTLRQEVDDIVE
jgi:hypothetical protein